MRTTGKIGAMLVLSLAYQVASALDFQGIGTLDGYTNVVYGMSADGSTVVGVTGSSSGQQAFRWTGPLGIETLGVGLGAYGVSGDGSIVVGGGSESGFLWTQSGGVETLSMAARDVSRDGTVVVGHANNLPGSQPTYWTASSGVVILPGVAGAPHVGQALGISLDGHVIVGVAATGTDGPTTVMQAVAWTDGGTPTILGAGPTSTAAAASADGSVVVGYYFVIAEWEYRAFRWTETDGFQPLPELPGGTDDMRALAVSGDGSLVVGWSVNPTTGNEEAFIWDSVNGTRRIADILSGLQTLDGWHLGNAWGISADGRFLTGHGVNPDGLSESWIADLAPVDVSELFDALLASVVDIGPDRKLTKTVALAETYYDAGDLPATCAQLTYFNEQVQNLVPKREGQVPHGPKITQEHADDLIGQSTAIMEAVGCP